LQRIRTALRTSGGRFFCEGDGVEGRDRAVEGATDIGGDDLEPDRSEQVAEGLRGAHGLLLQELLKVGQAVFDPLDRRRAEDLVSTAAPPLFEIADRDLNCPGERSFSLSANTRTVPPIRAKSIASSMTHWMTDAVMREMSRSAR
jgi:hypothetical protein